MPVSVAFTAIAGVASYILASQTNPHFAVKGASGFLQAEVVIELSVCQIVAFKRDVVTSLLQTVGEAHVMGKLSRDILFALFGAEALGIERKLVLVVVVVGEAQLVAFGSAVVPVQGNVGVREQIGLVRNTVLVGEVFLSRTFVQCPDIVAHIHA